MTAQPAALKKVVRKQMTLAEAAMLFLDGKTNANEVARAFLTDGRVKSLMIATAHKMKLQGLEGDLTQDSLTLFHEKYMMTPGAMKLPAPESVYSLVFSIGEGIALTKRREHEQNKHGFISLDAGPNDDEDTFGDILTTEEDFEAQHLQEFDIARGGREWDRILQSGHDSPLNRHIRHIITKAEDALSEQRQQPARQAGLRPEKNTTDARLTADQRRLKEIRKEIGLKLKDYAVYLSITEASLSAYIYGRTEGVPADVMRTAESLYRQHADRFEQQKIVYEGKSMDEIISYWCSILEMDRQANDNWVGEIARLTSVRPISVRRWIQEKYRPPMRKLIAFGVAMEEHMKRRKREG